MTDHTNKINLSLIIPSELAHERLDLTLAKLLPDYSRTQIKEWIDAGTIRVDGESVKGKLKLKGGETITLTNAARKAQPEWAAQDIPLHIVYEDEALLIINKRAGMVVHPGTGNADRTLLNALLHHAPLLQSLPRAGILHRLDKDTSGLLMIAKTPTALKNLTDQLKERSLQREYQAIVYGRFISGGTVDAPVGRHPLQRKRMAVNESGKPAITHYRIMEKYRAQTRLKVSLETGRTHQIRVHMSHIHHPLVGDVTYGGRVALSKGMTQELIQALRIFKRQALHAFALGFKHPVTDEFQRIEIDLPEDMQLLIAALKDDKERSKT